VNAIAAALKAVTPGEPLTSGGFTMVPLLDGRDASPGYLTLDEAIGTGSFRVTEVSESGSVPELLVLNDLGKPVLVVDGEELIGAKQNRIVNLTILVPARSRIHLPVSCVEAGRWHHRTRHFGTAPRTYYASGRAMKARAVTESYRMVGRPVSDQGAIWDDIARKSERLLAHSDTSAMDVMYDGSASELRHFEAHFEPVAGQTGAVFLIAGAPIGLDLFDSPATWQKLAPKLVASYGLDAVDRGTAAGVTREPRFVKGAAEDLLARVRELQVERYPSAGLGEDFRLSGPSLAGGALVVEEALVHLAVFPR
jgi:hypothetical protein